MESLDEHLAHVFCFLLTAVSNLLGFPWSILLSRLNIITYLTFAPFWCTRKAKQQQELTNQPRGVSKSLRWGLRVASQQCDSNGYQLIIFPPALKWLGRLNCGTNFTQVQI